MAFEKYKLSCNSVIYLGVSTYDPDDSQGIILEKNKIYLQRDKNSIFLF